MEKINASLSALQGAFTPYDEISLFTYSSSVKKQVGFTAAQSAALQYALQNSKKPGREPLMPMGGPMSQKILVNDRPGDPNTTTGGISGNIHAGEYADKEFHALNDAILAAAQQTATADRGRRRIVFVISDGKEYGSKAKEKDVIKYLQTNKVAVYATLVGDASIPGMGFLDRIHLPYTMRGDVLPRYAAATGGQCDPEFRPKGIETSFAKIAETVRTQYTVGYYSHESLMDSRFRKVEVRIMKPDLTVIAKEGYYPSAHDSAPVPAAKPVAATKN
jgi:VWFA-related protein